MILGVDPGNEGALVLTDGKEFQQWAMPLKIGGKSKEVDFDKVCDLLMAEKSERKHPITHIILERAMPLAMGSSHAFSYGRNFGFLEIAIRMSKIPVTYVLPLEWQKMMHEGISADLKSKAKSLIAVERLFPQFMDRLPRKPKGAIMDGPVDALLLAGWGLRKFRHL